MEGTRKIMRKSIYIFLQNYQNFTTIAALIAFPFSVSVLISQSFLVPSSSSIHNRLRALFEVAGVPGSSKPITILILKLSQTISCSIFTLPFSLTFFLISKAYLIQTLHQNKPTLLLYKPLFVTHLCSLFIVLSVNATALSVFFLGFNLVQETLVSSPNWVLILSATGAVIYSVILANAVVVCKLALVSSVIEGCGGWIAILKALVLMRGRTTTALSLALPVTMVLAGIEALFQYRIVRRGDRSYGHGSTPVAMAVEGMLIAYLYSIFVVLDTVVNYMFFKSCMRVVEQEAMHTYRIDFIEQESDVLKT